MNLKRQGILLMIILLAMLPGFGTVAADSGNTVETRMVTINKIKIFGNNFTTSETIMSFIKEFSENSVMESQKLDILVKRIEERLNNTTWFYNAKVYWNPLADQPDKVNVIVEVGEGYRYRYWGGYIYGGFGIDNIKGRGNYFGVELGSNKQYFTYKDRDLLAPFYYQIQLGNQPLTYYSLSSDEVDLQGLIEQMEIGYELPYDWTISAVLENQSLFFDNHQYLDEYSAFGGKLTLDRRNHNFSPSNGCYFELYVQHFFQQNLNRFTADTRLYVPLGSENAIGAFRFHVGTQDVEPLNQYFLLSLNGINGIRSEYSTDKIGNAFIQLNNEIRVKLYKTQILGGVDLNFEPALFLDIGKAFSQTRTVSAELLIGYGTALRIYFGAPVYLPIRLEYGWGQDGNSRFFFSVEKSF